MSYQNCKIVLVTNTISVSLSHQSHILKIHIDTGTKKLRFLVETKMLVWGGFFCTINFIKCSKLNGKLIILYWLYYSNLEKIIFLQMAELWSGIHHTIIFHWFECKSLIWSVKKKFYTCLTCKQHTTLCHISQESKKVSN